MQNDTLGKLLNFTKLHHLLINREYRSGRASFSVHPVALWNVALYVYPIYIKRIG